jgi:hypothetical protein
VHGHALAESGDLLGKAVAGFLAQARRPPVSVERTASNSRATSSSPIACVCLNGDSRAAWRISSE